MEDTEYEFKTVVPWTMLIDVYILFYLRCL